MTEQDYYLDNVYMPESDRRSSTVGTIYLLHFDQPFHHAKHYLGFAINLQERLEQHLQGRGSALTKAVTAAGIGMALVRTWEGDRSFERQLKNQSSTRLCPLCRAAYLESRRYRMRRRRQKSDPRN